MNSKLCQTAEMEFFPQVVTGFRGKLFCHISKMKLFAKIIKNEKRFTIFAKIPSWMLEKVSNILLNWLPQLKMFYF